MSRPGGRPVTESRMLAILNGDKTYHGKRCKKCGATERYTRGGGSCVACQRAHSIESRAALKRIAAEEVYVGSDSAVMIDDCDAHVQAEQEACYLGKGNCPTPNDCDGGCAGAARVPDRRQEVVQFP